MDLGQFLQPKSSNFVTLAIALEYQQELASPYLTNASSGSGFVCSTQLEFFLQCNECLCTYPHVAAGEGYPKWISGRQRRQLESLDLLHPISLSHIELRWPAERWNWLCHMKRIDTRRLVVKYCSIVPSYYQNRISIDPDVRTAIGLDGMENP